MEYPDAYVLRSDVAGLNKKDVNVKVRHGQCLVISGERLSDDTGKGSRIVERYFGKFSRQICLPRGANLSLVDARVTDGLLSVRVEKRAGDGVTESKLRSCSAYKFISLDE